MQDLGRITTKIKLGGGLDILCVAIAGYVAANTVIKIDNWRNKAKDRKEMEMMLEAIKGLDGIADKIAVVEKKTEE